MHEEHPTIRMDLEFFPLEHNGKHFVLIRDHLGLVQEGKAVEVPLYRFMALLNGGRTIRDLQMELMHQMGGVLVGTEEIQKLLALLDDSFLLNSERYRKARDRIIDDFAGKPTRPSSHAGQAYPDRPPELRKRLEEILDTRPAAALPDGEVVALVCPHIDLSVGSPVYGTAYQMVQGVETSRVVILGVGHQMGRGLFCLTEKDFETPLGVVECDREMVARLREAGGDNIAENDFPHRSEHSIEFQLIFLQHRLAGDSFRIIPILCGFLDGFLGADFGRKRYLDKVGPLLETLRALLQGDRNTLLVAGVDLSHVGHKFGDRLPARHLESRATAHDRALLQALSERDADRFWEESRRVGDEYHVCGFSALACLLEILPPCKGHILDYRTWHEAATNSAVSFGAVAFTA